MIAKMFDDLQIAQFSETIAKIRRGLLKDEAIRRCLSRGNRF